MMIPQTTMHTTPYGGYENAATYGVLLAIGKSTANQDVSRYIESFLQEQQQRNAPTRERFLRREIEQAIQLYIRNEENTPIPDAIRELLHTWLMYAMGHNYINWPPLIDAITNGEKFLVGDYYSIQVAAILYNNEWESRSIYRHEQADEAILWMMEQFNQWLGIPEQRMDRYSDLSDLVLTIIEYYLSSVNWGQILADFDLE